jgi:hypothetical protein
MKQDQGLDVRQVHIYFSIFCFNAAWDLIAKPDRTPAEEDAMIHLAHTSLYHWSRRVDCTDQNLSIGYWLLARVYALACQGACALRYARSCLTISQRHGVARIFVGYAYEALARAYALVGDQEQVDGYLARANEIATALPDDDREQFLSDLAGL